MKERDVYYSDVSSLQGRLGFEPSRRKGLVYLLRFCVVYSNNKLVKNIVNSIIVWWEGGGWVARPC